MLLRGWNLYKIVTTKTITGRQLPKKVLRGAYSSALTMVFINERIVITIKTGHPESNDS